MLALQVKSEFRPETLAIPIILLTQMLRNRENKNWIVLLSICAWIQPTVFLMYILYIVATVTVKDIKHALSDVKILIICALLNLLIVYSYPYEIIDHISVLAHQGSSVYSENIVLNDFYVYYIKSNFFPFFGILFLLLLTISIINNKKLILMLPFLYFVAFSHFATIYTVYAFFLVLYMDIFNENTKNQILNKVQLAIGVIALIGLYQGISRDIFSYFKYHSSYNLAYSYYKNELAGKSICSVPQYFYIFMSSRELMNVKNNTNKQNCIYIHGASGTGGIELNRSCKLAPESPSHSTTLLSYGSRIFRSDSGYSYFICSAP